MESFFPLIELILPDFIIENYLLTHVEKSDERYHVYLEEKNYEQDDPRRSDLFSKGYFPSITLQDFPIRGHKVFFMSNLADGSIPRQVKLSIEIGTRWQKGRG